MSQEELQRLRENVALAHRILFQFGIIQNTELALGHVSARTKGADRIVCTPRGPGIYHPDMISAESMVMVDLEGNIVESPTPDTGTTGEIRLHTEIHKARPDVGSVIHAHPRYANLLTVLRKPILPMMLSGCELFLKPIHTYEREGDRLYWVGSKEIADLMHSRGGYAVLHRGHGATVVGETVQQATINMLVLEENARMNYLAWQVSGLDHEHLSNEFIKEAYTLDQTKRPPTHSSRIGALISKRQADVPYTVTSGGLWEALVTQVRRAK